MKIHKSPSPTKWERTGVRVISKVFGFQAESPISESPTSGACGEGIVFTSQPKRGGGSALCHFGAQVALVMRKKILSHGAKKQSRVTRNCLLSYEQSLR